MNYKTDLDLRLAVTDDIPSGRSPVHIECLYHDGDDTGSLAVYPDGAHCFACSANRGPLAFLADYHGFDLRAEYKEVKALAEGLKAGTIPPKRQAQAVDVDAIRNKVDEWAVATETRPEVRGYFARRGLEYETMADAKLGHTGRAYSIPVFNASGEVVWVKYRRDDSIEQASPKYWAHPGLTGTYIYYPPNFKRWATWRGPVVVTEGEFDALILAQRGVPALTTNNGVRAIKNVAGLIALYEGAVLALDQDTAGREGAREVSTLLRDKGVRHTVAEWNPKAGKDASEVFANGYGDKLLDRLRGGFKAIKGVQ